MVYRPWVLSVFSSSKYRGTDVRQKYSFRVLSSPYSDDTCHDSVTLLPLFKDNRRKMIYRFCYFNGVSMIYIELGDSVSDLSGVVSTT